MNVRLKTTALVAGVVLLGVLVGPAVVRAQGAKDLLPLRRYDDPQGGFSVLVPKGWQVYRAGAGSTLGFVMRDPKNPLRQVIFSGTIGPVYTDARRKRYEMQFPAIIWRDAPLVNPVTAENFLVHFCQVARTRLWRSYMPQALCLDRLTVIHGMRIRPVVSVPGADAKTLRAVFAKNGRPGQGLFSLTITPDGPARARAFLFAGITAALEEFEALQPVLLHVLKSFTVSPQYAMAHCRSSAIGAGQTLSDTSDMIMAGWKRRNDVQDAMAVKRSDATLGVMRVWDPENGRVYSGVSPTWYEQTYNLNRARYRMANLMPIPANRHDLWKQASLDFRQNFH